MEEPIEVRATRSRWRRSRSFVQPLLVTLVGVQVSFWIAVALVSAAAYLVGVLITGFLAAMTSKDLRRGAIAAVVALGILVLAFSILNLLAAGPDAGLQAAVTLGIYAGITLLPLGLGLGMGAAIAVRRRRGRAAGAVR